MLGSRYFCSVQVPFPDDEGGRTFAKIRQLLLPPREERKHCSPSKILLRRKRSRESAPDIRGKKGNTLREMEEVRTDFRSLAKKGE